MTAGYSGTPLHKKLGLRAGTTVLQIGLPDDVRRLIEQGIGPIQWTGRAASVSAAHIFCTSVRDMKKHLARVRALLRDEGFVWVSWPKKTSGVASDLTEHEVRAEALGLGLVDVKVCAVTDIWSALKLVVPLKSRRQAPRGR